MDNRKNSMLKKQLTKVDYRDIKGYREASQEEKALVNQIYYQDYAKELRFMKIVKYFTTGVAAFMLLGTVLQIFESGITANISSIIISLLLVVVSARLIIKQPSAYGVCASLDAGKVEVKESVVLDIQNHEDIENDVATISDEGELYSMALRRTSLKTIEEHNNEALIVHIMNTGYYFIVPRIY